MAIYQAQAARVAAGLQLKSGVEKWKKSKNRLSNIKTYLSSFSKINAYL